MNLDMNKLVKLILFVTILEVSRVKCSDASDMGRYSHGAGRKKGGRTSGYHKKNGSTNTWRPSHQTSFPEISYTEHETLQIPNHQQTLTPQFEPLKSRFVEEQPPIKAPHFSLHSDPIETSYTENMRLQKPLDVGFESLKSRFVDEQPPIKAPHFSLHSGSMETDYTDRETLQIPAKQRSSRSRYGSFGPYKEIEEQAPMNAVYPPLHSDPIETSYTENIRLQKPLDVGFEPLKISFKEGSNIPSPPPLPPLPSRHPKQHGRSLIEDIKSVRLRNRQGKQNKTKHSDFDNGGEAGESKGQYTFYPLKRTKMSPSKTYRDEGKPSEMDFRKVLRKTRGPQENLYHTKEPTDFRKNLRKTNRIDASGNLQTRRG